MKNKAIFFDRDGTLIKIKGEHPPFKPEDMELYPDTLECLQKLQNKYLLFIVSNQPDFAKGLTTLQALTDVHKSLHIIFKQNGIHFTDYYYCYHHPSVQACKCRKPGTEFIEIAEIVYNLDMKNSWFLGDQDTDIQCGKKAGIKTILLEALGTEHKRGHVEPNFKVKTLSEATKIISGV